MSLSAFGVSGRVGAWSADGYAFKSVSRIPYSKAESSTEWNIISTSLSGYSAGCLVDFCSGY